MKLILLAIAAFSLSSSAMAGDCPRYSGFYDFSCTSRDGSGGGSFSEYVYVDCDQAALEGTTFPTRGGHSDHVINYVDRDESGKEERYSFNIRAWAEWKGDELIVQTNRVIRQKDKVLQKRKFWGSFSWSKSAPGKLLYLRKVWDLKDGEWDLGTDDICMGRNLVD